MVDGRDEWQNQWLVARASKDARLKEAATEATPFGSGCDEARGLVHGVAEVGGAEPVASGE